MTDVAKGGERHAAIGANAEMCEAAVRQREAQPGLGRQLQCAAHKVADDVGVAHDERVAVGRLIRASAVKVPLESLGDARACRQKVSKKGAEKGRKVAETAKERDGEIGAPSSFAMRWA